MSKRSAEDNRAVRYSYGSTASTTIIIAARLTLPKCHCHAAPHRVLSLTRASPSEIITDRNIVRHQYLLTTRDGLWTKITAKPTILLWRLTGNLTAIGTIASYLIYRFSSKRLVPSPHTSAERQSLDIPVSLYPQRNNRSSWRQGD